MLWHKISTARTKDGRNVKDVVWHDNANWTISLAFLAWQWQLQKWSEMSMARQENKHIKTGKWHELILQCQVMYLTWNGFGMTLQKQSLPGQDETEMGRTWRLITRRYNAISKVCYHLTFSNMCWTWLFDFLFRWWWNQWHTKDRKGSIRSRCVVWDLQEMGLPDPLPRRPMLVWQVGHWINGPSHKSKPCWGRTV